MISLFFPIDLIAVIGMHEVTFTPPKATAILDLGLWHFGDSTEP
jgi:hypothetical protein